MKQTASFNPFPRRPTEQEIEKRITAEDALRLKYSALNEQDQTTTDETQPRAKSLLRTIANPIMNP